MPGPPGGSNLLAATVALDGRTACLLVAVTETDIAVGYSQQWECAAQSHAWVGPKPGFCRHGARQNIEFIMTLVKASSDPRPASRVRKALTSARVVRAGGKVAVVRRFIPFIDDRIAYSSSLLCSK